MYIFLDVDGVLNTKADWKRLYALNPACVKEFCEFIREIDKPKIVLSSSWRNGIARDGSRAAHIEDLMKVLSDVGITNLEKTGVSPDGMRNREIEHYLKYHDADKYIILDDDVSLFEKRNKTAGLYIVNSEYGFTALDRKALLRKYKK